MFFKMISHSISNFEFCNYREIWEFSHKKIIILFCLGDKLAFFF